VTCGIAFDPMMAELKVDFAIDLSIFGFELAIGIFSRSSVDGERVCRSQGGDKTCFVRGQSR
jgi:hypothetical protein